MEISKDVGIRAATTPDWRDDPGSDERWQEGCDFAMVRLCEVLGVDPQSVSWDAATETVDGDVQAVIGNILRAKYGEDWGRDDPAQPVAATPHVTRSGICGSG